MQKVSEQQKRKHHLEDDDFCKKMYAQKMKKRGSYQSHWALNTNRNWRKLWGGRDGKQFDSATSKNTMDNILYNCILNNLNLTQLCDFNLWFWSLIVYIYLLIYITLFLIKYPINFIPWHSLTFMIALNVEECPLVEITKLFNYRINRA